MLDVLITSGGTICPIDDVRSIGNFSNGTTGALIAEELLRNSYNVHYLHNKTGVQPFRRNLILNPEKKVSSEIRRLREECYEFNKYKRNLKEYSFVTFEDYFNSLKEILTSKPIKVVILAAAVSDYGTKKAIGKISSDKENLTIELSKNPKVIEYVKSWKPEVFQIGFKLLTNKTLDELVNVAYNSGKTNNSDLIVANSINNQDVKNSITALVYNDGNYLKIQRNELPRKLVEIIIQNLS